MNPADVSFEDYVGMSGVAKAWGLERMLAHYRIDMNAWTQIAGMWNQRIPTDLPRFGTYGLLVEQEAARVATGGPPRVLGASPGPGGVPAALMATQPAPPMSGGQPPVITGVPQQQPQQPPGAQPPMGAQQPYGQQPYPQQQQQYGQQQFERDAEKFGNALGSAASAGFNALGSAFGGLGKSLSSIGIGSHVLVTWSDGKRYPGTVAQVAQGQYLITMGDGQQHWIGAAYVSQA